MSSYDVDCPYCGEGQDVCHDDGFGYEENEKHQMECRKCEKTFIFTTSISFDYYPDKADCLNEGGNHDLQEMCGAPREFFVGKRRCSICDEEVVVDEEANKKAMKEYMDGLNKDCQKTVKTVEKFVGNLQQREEG